jgi:protein SCO1/2
MKMSSYVTSCAGIVLKATSAICVGWCVFWFSGCGDQPKQDSSANTKQPQSQAASERHPLEGRVVKIDRETGLVAIRHYEIAGYMPAMTMSFPLKDDPILAELQPGDQVRGTLVVEAGSSRLIDLVITELADSSAAIEQARVDARLKPGQAVPDFTVTTQADTQLRLSELRGNVVILTFIYTRCPLPDYCPAMDRKFADLSRRLKLLGEPAQKVRMLSISFDPENDTPEVLANHAKMLGAADPLWTFCVATHEELRRVAPAFGLSYGPGEREIIHTLSTAVINADGRLIALELGNNWKVEAVFATIRKQLSATH